MIVHLLAPALGLLLAVSSGLLVGQVTGSLPCGWLAGALIGGCAMWLRDFVHGQRLMRWLRTAVGEEAPRARGYWGELAYRIERALRQRERKAELERDRLQQFLSGIEASPNGVMLLDARDQIEWCNSMAALHFGLDPVRDLHQRATNLIRSPIFVAYLQGGRFEQPVCFVDPRGQATLSVQVRPYGQGQSLVLSQDITERERTEAMRRDFVANVSHEIRTPLTVLAGFVETLQQLPLTEAERTRALALMAQQTSRMQVLVADLLTLAQLEGNPPPSTVQWQPVAALLKRALDDATALSVGRHTLSCVGDDGAEIAGEESELLSAVGNLVSNAVRYTPVNGRIALRWLDRGDGGGAIEVVDDGPGIAREHLARLTERFYRVDSSRSRDTGGTGLGLAIVKHVAQRHGGEIQIESEPGRGATFRLVFPALRVRSRQRVMVESSIKATGADGR